MEYSITGKSRGYTMYTLNRKWYFRLFKDILWIIFTNKRKIDKYDVYKIKISIK